MQNLFHTAAITEGLAMNLIFDACHANTDRQTREVGSMVVKFEEVDSNEHVAKLYNVNGKIIATAIIDSSDI